MKIYQSEDGVWYKKTTPEETHRENMINRAIDHSFGRAYPHCLENIKGSERIQATFVSLQKDIADIRTRLNHQNADLAASKNNDKKLKHLEKKLSYNAWFFKNPSYSMLEFDSFEDKNKLFYGNIKDHQLVPEKPDSYSIYRTIKFIPQMNKPITRYMMHLEYVVEAGGGLVVEISFDDGNRYHTVLSTVENPHVAYYYQYPNFCDCDNNVPELNADSFIVRFRLLANKAGAGVFVSSYGILLA